MFAMMMMMMEVVFVVMTIITAPTATIFIISRIFFADGERVFFVSNPAIGLWSTRARFNSDPTSHAQTMALVESHTAADDGI